jgi:hypothetical protein
VDFTFDVWFYDPVWDKMFLATCGDRENHVTMALE